MSTEPAEPEKATLHFTIWLSENPPFDLPTTPDGGHVAAELDAFRDITDRPVPIPNLNDDDQTASDGARLTIPRLTIPSPPILSLKTQFRVDTSHKAYYARASTLLDDSAVLDFRFTCRPQDHYVFVASYLLRFVEGPPKFELRNCYSVRMLPFNDGDDLGQLVNAAIPEEVRDLCAGDRSPINPHIGVAPPLIDEFVIGCRDAVEVKIGLPGKPFRMKFDDEKFASLLPMEQRAVREVLEMTAPRAALPEGPRPKVPADAIVGHIADLVRFFEALLVQLPRDTWPAFSTRSGAAAFLTMRLDATAEEIADIAELLVKGLRRPKAEDLAQKFARRTTGLSARRLRDLTRQ